MIVTTPNPVLTAPAKPVTKIDKKIREIIGYMKKTLIETDNPKGVGLAAPQIGVPLRIFVTRPADDSPIDVFINPEILWRSPKMSEIQRPKSKLSIRKEKKLEGCLSIPNIWGYLKRPSKVRLRYQDESGKTKTGEFKGFMATIIQHETDHVNGILFTQRVLEQKSKLYRIEEEDEGEEKLIEVEI